MQAAFRHKRQLAHEAKHHGPPAVQPRPFCKIRENDVGLDAPAELTEIAEEGKLDVLHVFQLWDQGQRAGRSPDLAPRDGDSSGCMDVAQINSDYATVSSCS